MYILLIVDGPEDGPGGEIGYMGGEGGLGSFNGGIFGSGTGGGGVGMMPSGIPSGIGMPSAPNNMIGQRSTTGGAPGLPMAGLGGGQSSLNPSYPSNSLNNSMSNLSMNGGSLRSTSAPNTYGNNINDQAPGGELFALLNKGGQNSGQGLSGSSNQVNGMGGAPGGISAPLPSQSGQSGNETSGVSTIPGSVDMGVEQQPFDINEFPALGGAPGTGRNGGGVGMMGLGGNFGAYPDSSLALGSHAEFTSMMSEESFPSLPGDKEGGNVTSESNDSLGSKQGAQYGLMGLLSVIRMMDADLNTLALGSDLTTLGLNLNSARCLYSTFSSPWADGPSKSDPQ